MKKLILYSLLIFIDIISLILIFPVNTRAGTFYAFGPEDYARATDAPVVVTDQFSVLNPNTSYTMHVYNGGKNGEWEHQVSSAVVNINSVIVLRPSDFNENVLLLIKSIELSEDNQINIELRSAPISGITLEIIGIDNDPPTITATANPLPNADDWNASDVTVSFTCSDDISGIASCPGPVVIHTEGANQVVSGTATDLAGNTATAEVVLNIDKTQPIIAATANPLPNAADWNASDVTVSFVCSDALSGIASCPSPDVLQTEGAGQPSSGTAVDLAGNTATANINVSIDKTPPVVTISSPVDGGTSSELQAHVSGIANDDLSGIAIVTCNGNLADLLGSSFTVDSSLYSGANVITVEAEDMAGNLGHANISIYCSISVLGPLGGTFQGEGGVSITVPPGACDQNVQLEIQSVEIDSLGVGIPPGYTFLSAVSLDIGDIVLENNADMEIPCPPGVPEDAEIYVAKIFDEYFELLSYQMTDTASVQGSKIVTEDPGFPGIIMRGIYVFLWAQNDGWVSGQVIEKSTSNPVPNAVVTLKGIFTDITDENGLYRLPVGNQENWVITAIDTQTSSIGETQVTLPFPGAEIASDIQIYDIVVDEDKDGFIAAKSGGGDCDDSNVDTFPGAPEICDGLDNDCDKSVPLNEIDGDGDGYSECQGDCNDIDASTFPDQIELCYDNRDNDCDGIWDTEDTDCNSGCGCIVAGSNIVWYYGREWTGDTHPVSGCYVYNCKDPISEDDVVLPGTQIYYFKKSKWPNLGPDTCSPAIMSSECKVKIYSTMCGLSGYGGEEIPLIDDQYLLNTITDTSQSPGCSIDDDADGYTEDDGDCDDTNPLILTAMHPEVNGDGIDNNCDGAVDNCVDSTDCCMPGTFFDQNSNLCVRTPEVIFASLMNDSWTLAHAHVEYKRCEGGDCSVNEEVTHYKQTLPGMFEFFETTVPYWDVYRFIAEDPLNEIQGVFIDYFDDNVVNGTNLVEEAWPTGSLVVPSGSYDLVIRFHVIEWCWPGGPFGLWDPYCHYREHYCRVKEGVDHVGISIEGYWWETEMIYDEECY